MKWGLFHKLMLTYLAVILITVFILGGAFHQLLVSYTLDAKADELEREGQQISQLATRHFLGDIDQRSLSFVLSVLDKFAGARVWVVDKTGLIRMASLEMNYADGRIRPTRGLRLQPGETQKVLSGNVVRHIGKSPYFNEPMLTVAVPITTAGDARRGEVLGAVFLNAPIIGVTASAVKLFRYLLWAALLAGLIAAGLGVYLSRTISRPLRKMKEAALSMANGNYCLRMPTEGNDEIGELAHAFNVLSDNLEKNIEALLGEKGKLDSMLSSMAEGVIALDREGKLIRLNPSAEQLLGIKEKDLLGADWSRISPSADLVEPFIKALENGASGSYTFSFATKKLAVSVSPIYGGEHEILGAVAVLQDVSEAERLEEMRREFVANASHELRTPLAIVKGYNDALLDGVVTDPETRENFHLAIRHEVTRLERLVKDLLDLSRLQSGKTELETVPLDISGIIKATANKMKGAALGRNVSVKLQLPDELPEVMGNEDRLTQLLIILLDNALQFSPEGGEIKIRAADKGKEVWVSVEDQGMGIPPEHLPYIWERFYKVDKARTRTDSGTGLGLAIAREIVKLHQGEIWVDSRVGYGTTFTFSLKTC